MSQTPKNLSRMPPIETLGVHYIFRSPVPSSIYPFITDYDETLSLLHEINTSQCPSRRLPNEILREVNNELHRPNSLWEDIRSTWKPVGEEFNEEDNDGPKLRVKLDLETRRYHVAQEEPTTKEQKFTSIENITDHVSCADLLYRLLCYFPGIDASTRGMDGFKCVWGVMIQHQPTGVLLYFSEYKANGEVHAYYSRRHPVTNSDEETAVTKIFLADCIKLLNALFGTVDGTRRFICYHPAADADHPTSEECYIAVPLTIGCFRIQMDDDEDDRLSELYHRKWDYSRYREQHVPSSLRSILQDLKYNTQTRKIDRSNGSASLTTVISSALLLFRLVCQYIPVQYGFLDESHQTPSITSVWQIQLTHDETKESVVFMDDRGLFDIRATAGIDKAMDDVDALVEALCSDTCTHPYDGVVAGCVA